MVGVSPLLMILLKKPETLRGSAVWTFSCACSNRPKGEPFGRCKLSKVRGGVAPNARELQVGALHESEIYEPTVCKKNTLSYIQDVITGHF
jgi:hypothetical protein